jgi:hypothetical protein
MEVCNLLEQHSGYIMVVPVMTMKGGHIAL